GDLGDRTVGRIEIDVRRSRAVGSAHVAFDVAGADLQVADLAAPRHDAAAVIVRDVASHDGDLMQVHPVQKHADPAVVVQVAVGDLHVAVAFGDVNRVQAVADGDPRDGRLHRAGQLDAAGLFVAADDLDAVDQRHPLAVPDVWFDGTGSRGP